MNKNIVRIVSLTSAVIMLASGTVAFGYPSSSVHERLISAKSYYAEVSGNIVDITDNEVTVRVNSKDMIFETDRKTSVKNSDGSSISASKLTEGMTVKITYDTKSWYSKDGTYYAESILIAQESIKIKDAVIKDLYDKNGIDYIVISYGKNNKILEQTVALTKNSVIYDQFGLTADYDYLEDDMVVDAEFASSSNDKAYQSLIYLSVVKHGSNSVVTEDKVVKVETNKNDSFIYTGISDDINKQKLFIVDKDTLIRNENGKAVKISDIKNGQRVKIEHSAASTRSIPPQSYAYTVQITKGTTGTLPSDDCGIHELISKLYNDYSYDDFVNCLMNHDHDWGFEQWDSSSWPGMHHDEGWKNGWFINGKWDDMDKDDWKEFKDSYKNHDWSEWHDDYNFEMGEVRATVKSVDAKNNTLNVSVAYTNNDEIKVYLSDDADIEDKNGGDINLSDLKIGAEIKIDVEYLNGKFYTDDIEVVK